MKSYFDTSVLVKLYVPEEDSEAICTFIQNRGKSIAINSLQKTELKNAFALKAFRQDISYTELEELLNQMKEDIRRDRITLVKVDWIKLWEVAQDYSLRFTGTIGCRTMDILHVAAAKVMNAEEFYTNDKRQQKLTEAIGIKTYLYPVVN
jgi:predicted nucleic acid-binding protein